MKINEKEIWRYLGYGTQQPDEQTRRLIRESKEEIQKVMTPRYDYRKFPCDLTENGWIQTAGLRIHSESLFRALWGCDEVIFFAATLGSGVDRLMSRYNRLSISRAAVLQAVGAAAMEDYCDVCQEQIAADMKKEKKYIRPRFSPGYGDFLLEFQKDFLRVLDASKTVGIFLSDGDVMIPEKSVSAMIGVCKEKMQCRSNDCELCEKRNCSYRR